MRKILTTVVVLALMGPGTGAVASKPRAKPRPVTYYMNWFGDCAGGGYLSLKAVPNPDDCALFFPGLGSSHAFRGSAGLPLVLDASQKVVVDFELIHVAQVAADFEVVVTAAIDGEETEVARGVQTLLAAGVGRTALHYELEPDAALDGAALESLTATVNWTNGVSYSSIDLQSDTARVVLEGRKAR